MTSTNTSNAAPVFVVGCPRSGNTLVGCLLNKHPSFAVFFERSTFYSLRTRWIEQVQLGAEPRACLADIALTSLGEWLEHHTQITLARDEIISTLREVAPTWPKLIDAFMRLQMRKAKPSAIRWGDKTPQHVASLTQILRDFPYAKIVYVYRDPRHSVASLSNPAFPHASNDDVVNAEMLLHYQRVWDRQSRQIPPTSVFEVRYEALLDNPRSLLEELCLFLGVEFTDTMLGDVDPAVVAGIGWRDYKGWRAIEPQSSRQVVLSDASLALLEPLLRRMGYPYTPAGPATRFRALVRSTRYRSANRVLNTLWRARHPSSNALFLKDLPSLRDYLRWALPDTSIEPTEPR